MGLSQDSDPRGLSTVQVCSCSELGLFGACGEGQDLFTIPSGKHHWREGLQQSEKKAVGLGMLGKAFKRKDGVLEWSLGLGELLLWSSEQQPYNVNPQVLS